MLTSIHLRTHNSQFVSAENGGGDILVANRNVPLNWETFKLDSIIPGTEIEDGSLVAIQVNNGQYIYCENAGGSDVYVAGDAIGNWEPFTLKRLSGSGKLQNGDQVAFLCADRTHYLSAENGGGGKVYANRNVVDIWETFTITILPPRRVRIEIESIYCDNTEDITGSDELYFVGASFNRFDGKANPILTSPIDINDGETKYLPVDQRVVFDGEVQVADTIVVFLRALDEDAAKDWDKREEMLRKIGDDLNAAIELEIKAAGIKSIKPGSLFNTVVSIVGFAVSLDNDDSLGDYNVEFPVSTLQIPESKPTWDFYRNRVIGYSTWKYKLTFAIFVG